MTPQEVENADPIPPGEQLVKSIGNKNKARTSGSMPGAVADELRGQILDGTIGPGERINIRDLERRLNVSHIPIREAMRLLEAEGLVETKPNVGAVATTVSLKELEDIYDLRRIIEPAVARRAAQLMSDDHIEQLRETLVELEALEEASDGTDEEFISTHRRFHWELLAPGATPVIERSLERLWRTSERYLRLTRGAAARTADVQHEHLVDLCAKRESDALADLLAEHLHLTANTLQVLYGRVSAT